MAKVGAPASPLPQLPEGATVSSGQRPPAGQEAPTLASAFKWTFGEARIAPYLADGSVNVRARSAADVGIALQPIVDARDGSLFAYEALVRCKVPALQSPPVLLELAETQNACGSLGRMIREVAFPAAGDVALFVNIHPQELSSRWLVRTDDPIGFHSRDVYLEITETAAFEHFDLCSSTLREVCQRTGAKLVVDDFGAGHSNLQRLLELEPAVVKLDMQLIRNIQRERKKQLAVRHMVALCRDLGAKTVAEGIETVDELRCVVDLGVDWLQGYLLGKPAFPAPPALWPMGAQPQPRKSTAPRPSAKPGTSKRPSASRKSLNPAANAAPIRPTRTVGVAARRSSKPGI